jgi:hypothetical protein
MLGVYPKSGVRSRKQDVTSKKLEAGSKMQDARVQNARFGYLTASSPRRDDITLFDLHPFRNLRYKFTK